MEYTRRGQCISTQKPSRNAQDQLALDIRTLLSTADFGARAFSASRALEHTERPTLAEARAVSGRSRLGPCLVAIERCA